MEGGVEARLRSLLGLSGYEARAYLALLRLGSAQPADVAREAGIPRQRVYDVLKRLEWRGLVRSTGGHYAPVPPEEALAAEGERRILRAKREAEELAELARELAGVSSPGGGSESVMIVHGLDSAIAWAAAILDSCGDKPLFTAYKAAERLEELWPLLGGLLEKIRGGALVVVPEGAAIPGWALEEAGRRGVEVVRAPCVLLDLMIACDRVIIGLPGPGGDVVGVLVQSREFAGALRRRIKSLLGSCGYV